MALSVATKKKIVDLIASTYGTLDPTGKNKERVLGEIEEMSDSQFETWIREAVNPENTNLLLEVVPYINEPTLEDIEKTAKNLDLELHQYIDYSDGTRSREKVPVGYLPVRRLQQIVMKKTGFSSSSGSDARSVTTGQLVGESAAGRVADEETIALNVMGAKNVMKELLGPRADDRRAGRALKFEVARDGYTQLKNLPKDRRDSKTLNYLDVLLLGAGLNNDLVRGSLLLLKTPDS